MRLGIDFGTTNSSVAFYDGQRLFPVRLDPAADNPDILPSLIYIDRAHQVTLGSAAADEYLRHETGRPVVWEKRLVGEIEVFRANTLHRANVGDHGRGRPRAVVTVGQDGAARRYLRGTEIFGRFYTLDELIAFILSALRQRVRRISASGVRVW